METESTNPQGLDYILRQRAIAAGMITIRTPYESGVLIGDSIPRSLGVEALTDIVLTQE